MRPDPSDIIDKKRLRKSSRGSLYVSRPLKPVNRRVISLLIGGFFFPSMIVFASFVRCRLMFFFLRSFLVACCLDCVWDEC